MTSQDLKSVSKKLHVGDVLRLTVIECDDCEDEDYVENFLSQAIEIPVACKHVTKNCIHVNFMPQKLQMEVKPYDAGGAFPKTFLEIFVESLYISRSGASERIGSLKYEMGNGSGGIDFDDTGILVKWKKIA